MHAFLISTVARLFSLMPLRLNQAVGSTLGRLAWLGNSRAKHITRFNLQHCYPEKTDAERQSLGYASLLHTGRQFAECGWIWHRPARYTQTLVRDIKGEQLYLDAVASPRGVIIVSPHIGNWELCSLILSQQTRFTYFYRSPRNKALEPLLLKWRAHLDGHPASLNAAGIRDGMRILKKGGVVGILPDQEPDFDNGVYAPFFNQPALSMTLLPRLAKRSNAHVIFIVTERLPNAQGWCIHFLPASADIVHDDAVIAATAMNVDVQRCIAICPEQYVWSYKRFNTLPDGQRRRYP